MKVLKEFEDVETDAMRYGSQMHEAAEHYVRDRTPLPPEFEYVHAALDSLLSIKGDRLCEYKMGLTESLEPCGFFGPEVWWRGIADLVILDAENGRAWVIDYKTSKSARYADKGQLELMALALFKHFPVVKQVKAGLLFVVCNDLVRDQYVHGDQTILWDKWLNKFDRLNIAFETNVWNANPSGLCKNHCPVLDCVHNGRN